MSPTSGGGPVLGFVGAPARLRPNLIVRGAAVRAGVTGLPEVDRLAVLWHFCNPAEAIVDGRAQRLHRDRLAVDDKCKPWRFRKPAEPPENLHGVGMGRHGFDELDARLDGNHLAV